MAAMLPSTRPMKESTTSSAEISISTPRAVAHDARSKFVLEGERELVVHIHLDRDQQEGTHFEYRNALHVGSRLRRA